MAAKGNRGLLAVAALVAVAALGATAWILIAEFTAPKTLVGEGLVPVPADTGGPFALIDHDGRPVTEAALKGEHALLYFGYSFCPDICPTTLQRIAAALDALGPAAARVRPVFISVDPERDTPAQLAGYVAAFHPRMLGLTGSKEKIDAVTRAFRVYYALRKDLDPEHYPVDHTSYSYLMDPDWKLVAVFRHDATPEAMAAALRERL